VSRQVNAALVRNALNNFKLRVAAGRLDEFSELVALQADVEAAIAYAADRLHDQYSWTEIGEAAGVSRQAAAQRWGGKKQ
jgi:hypothetical protein